MDYIERLTARRSENLGKAKAIAEKAESEDRGLTPEEKAEYDTALKAVDADTETIRERQALIERAKVELPPTPAEREAAPPKPAERITFHRVGPSKAFGCDEDAYRSGQWLRAIAGNSDANRWCEEHGVFAETRTMSATVPGTGGVFAPTAFSNAVIRLQQEYGVARREAGVTPMPGDTLIIPKITAYPTTYFVTEGAAVTATDVATAGVELTARKMACLVKVSRELFADSVISIADMVADQIARSFANKEDDCFFNGDGNATYGHFRGLKNSMGSASVYTAISGNTAYSTLDAADFESMAGQLPLYPGANPRWYMSKPAYYASMARLMDAAGGTTGVMMSGGYPAQFLGYDVVFSQVMNTTLTAQTSATGGAYFGDLRQGTAFGQVGGLEVEILRERYADNGLIGIIGFQRVAIACHSVGDSTNAGAVVSLTFPGS